MSENIACRETHKELGITPGQNEIKKFNEPQKILKISGILPSKIFCVNCHKEMPDATEKSTREGKFMVTCQNCGFPNTMCTEIGVVTGQENFDELILENCCANCELSCENKEMINSVTRLIRN